MSKRKLAPLTLDTPLASMPMSALSYLPELPEPEDEGAVRFVATHARPACSRHEPACDIELLFENTSTGPD